MNNRYTLYRDVHNLLCILGCWSCWLSCGIVNKPISVYKSSERRIYKAITVQGMYIKYNTGVCTYLLAVLLVRVESI